MAIGRRRRPAFWILLAFLFLGVVGQAVPLYTDWLWFEEVGFVDVFTTVLTLRGWLVIGLGLTVWAFLFANLWVAARVASYKRVAGVVLTERIPRSPSGKILRRELRAAAAERR